MKQIGEGIENLFTNILLGKKISKRHKSKKKFVHASLLRNGLNKFQFGIVQVIIMTCDLWNLKLSYLNEFQLIIISRIHNI